MKILPFRIFPPPYNIASSLKIAGQQTNNFLPYDVALNRNFGILAAFYEDLK